MKHFARLSVTAAAPALLGFVTALAIGAHGAPAEAQSVCATRGQIIDSLESEYAEAPQALGMGNDGNVIELLTTQDGSTWTLLLTMPDGTSCVVAAGEAWEALNPQLSQDPRA